MSLKDSKRVFLHLQTPSLPLLKEHLTSSPQLPKEREKQTLMRKKKKIEEISAKETEILTSSVLEAVISSISFIQDSNHPQAK